MGGYGATPLASGGGYGAAPIEEAPKTSAFSDFIANSPIGAVKGLADAIRNPGEALHAMAHAGDVPLQRAKDSYAKGDYAATAAHLLNYVLSPLGGGVMEQAGKDFQNGDIDKGVAKTLGLASTVIAGAHAPDIVQGIGNLADKAGMVKKVMTDPNVIREGVKILPKGAQVVKFYDTVHEAAKPLESTVAAQPEPETVPIPVGTATTGYAEPVSGHEQIASINVPRIPVQGYFPQENVVPAAQVVEDTAQLDAISRGMGGKSFKSLSPEGQAHVRQLAERISAGPQKIAVPPPVAQNATPAPEPVPVETPQPSAPPARVPQTFVPGGPLRPPVKAAETVPAPAPTPRPMTTPQAEAAMARKTPAPLEEPRSMYTASGELKSPELRAMEIENANRIAKAERFSEALHEHGISPDELQYIQAGRGGSANPKWGDIADAIGEEEPSDLTIKEIQRQMGVRAKGAGKESDLEDLLQRSLDLAKARKAQ